ncbi:TPA: hypothetical protein DIC39_03055 [Patescibacteria group bacterium]|nr:hypothetical protein [Patescibacteria group bacterium]
METNIGRLKKEDRGLSSSAARGIVIQKIAFIFLACGICGTVGFMIGEATGLVIGLIVGLVAAAVVLALVAIAEYRPYL